MKKRMLFLASMIFISCTPKEKGMVFVKNNPEKVVEMIEKSDCLSCHLTEKEFIGPSYMEISERYTENDLDYLSEKILEGGKGVWGDVPMTPHPKLSKEQADLMVLYILSLTQN